MNDNGTQYYYIRNAQEDIIGILDSSFNLKAYYIYDSWGKITATVDSATGKDVSKDSSHIAYKNPYRYRGYRYDNETGMYYLQSRYYNPEWGRFINADNLVSTGRGILGNNMYSYCDNNPINLVDENGNIWFIISAIIKLVTLVFEDNNINVETKVEKEFDMQIVKGSIGSKNSINLTNNSKKFKVSTYTETHNKDTKAGIKLQEPHNRCKYEYRNWKKRNGYKLYYS